MERVGIYTGNVYSEEDYKNDKCHECCIIVNKNGLESTKAYAKAQHSKYCDSCRSCEASRAG